jgi:Zn-finger nucleic acid-binding protein
MAEEEKHTHCAACGTKLKRKVIGRNVAKIEYCPHCKIWWEYE